MTDELTFKEILNDFDENYAKGRKLMEDSRKYESRNNPFLPKYKARDIFYLMNKRFQKYFETETDVVDIRIRAMIGVVLLNLGSIEMDTEDLTGSEKTLSRAVELLEPHGDRPEIVITLVSVYNNLGILWFNRDEPLKSKTYLFKAKALYEAFKSTQKLSLPIEHVVKELDENLLVDNVDLEKAFTLTLYYLAQVYGSLNKNLKSSVYCHITLRRQLELKDYDPIDWALNSATLAQVFAERDGFLQARHHLAASSMIMEKYEEELRSAQSTNEAYLAKVENFKHRAADVARCWAKYCILLMSTSRDRLMHDEEQPFDCEAGLSKLTFEDHEDIKGIDVTKLFFPDMDVSHFENQIGYQFLLTFQDAREVFLSCQEWLQKAKKYYKLDTLASDYIAIIQDTSQAFSYLAFFEEDDDRRAKMHKRRIDMLEELLQEVNPVYYLRYCRQIWFELGEIYSEILNIKLDKQNKIKGPPVPQALKKINSLCEKSIENYTAYLTSVKDKEGKMPATLTDDLIRPVISAYAFIGRNGMKRIAVDKKIQLMHVQQSLDAYQAVVDICTSNEAAATKMQEEFQLCQEMVNILPLKIKKLQQSIIE